jgi:hypothetical protein
MAAARGDSAILLIALVRGVLAHITGLGLFGRVSIMGVVLRLVRLGCLPTLASSFGRARSRWNRGKMRSHGGLLGGC